MTHASNDEKTTSVGREGDDNGSRCYYNGYDKQKAGKHLALRRQRVDTAVRMNVKAVRVTAAQWLFPSSDGAQQAK